MNQNAEQLAKETTAENDELFRNLDEAKTRLFVGTLWLSEKLVTSDWEPDVNRKLDVKKVAIMRSVWSKANNASLLRLKAENSVIVTILDEDFEEMIANILEEPDVNTFASLSLGPNNGHGLVFQLDEHFVTALAARKGKIFRIEAGQHRLRVIKDLAVAHHPGQWPAQIFRRQFSPPLLRALRLNLASFTLADSESDTLWTTSPLFKRFVEGWRSDKKLAKEIRKRLSTSSDKVATFFFKPSGLVWQEIIAYYPCAGIGVTGNRLAVLNGSYFQDVSTRSSSWQFD